MDQRESPSLRAIRFGIAAAECRRAAAEHPEARRALMKAAASYSNSATAELQAMVDRAERIQRRLRAKG